MNENMSENEKELFEVTELTDDMLEGISGGQAMTNHMKISVKNLVMTMKGDGKTIEQVEEYLSTKTTLSFRPDILEEAIAYTRSIW